MLMWNTRPDEQLTGLTFLTFDSASGLECGYMIQLLLCQTAVCCVSVNALILPSKKVEEINMLPEPSNKMFGRT
jgi:hypothetical protein